LSYVSAPITLTMLPVTSTTVQFTWPAGTLQSATNVVGPYISITNALSPFTTNSTTGAKFFRVKL